ncbi:hypothetical protein SAY86_027297 [Trapa natans]|uniref:Diacylglycerol O-acyltransferase n=1 Tax=Trapa natans TaxID=22666 RepID=A0AAN7KU57_TRANT|nr:hypothetical protein SAY86_027297 [Trapa natans]
MGFPEGGADEPLTPAGRLFHQKDTVQVVHCAIGMKNPIDVDAVKASIESSVMLKHPRFRSLLVRDSRGLEHWRGTEVTVDNHFIVVDEPIAGAAAEDHEAAVNEYLADLSMTPEMSTDKPLWEIHVLRAHACVILRIHHSLGDGISLMSMFLAACRKADDPDALPAVPTRKRVSGEGRSLSLRESAAKLLQMVWFTIVFVVGFLMRSMWMKDLKSPISGGDGVELWPRKLATARFWLDDMKQAKRAVAGATINDVLFSILSMGLSRYLVGKEPSSTLAGLQMTGVAMVNLREQPGLHEFAKMSTDTIPARRWGNRFGITLLPLRYCKSGSDPVDHLREAKRMLDRRKNSLEAYFSYWIGDLVMSCFGAKLASVLNKRIICNTTFTISNVVGPQERIAYLGNPITYIRANSCALPHALTMHMVSYADRADLQILVAKDIIPDPDFLARCFEDALLEMKEAAAGIIQD